LGLFFLAFLCPALSGAQAKLEVPEAKKSFGHVPKGEVVVLNYEIRNTGDQPLLMETSEVSCDCTKIRFSDAPILPGKTSTVQVTFDSKHAYGRQDRVVYLFSNDPKSPGKIRFKGTVDYKKN
jgi:hypothetical protein